MTARWELLGNAVSVPISKWIGERLAEPYKYKCERKATAIVAPCGAGIYHEVLTRAGAGTSTAAR